MNRKWLTVALVVCILVAAALPAAVLAGYGGRLTCGLSFDSAHDDTEARWRGRVWTIPPTGGNATLLVKAYADNWDRTGAFEDMPQALFDVLAEDCRPTLTKDEELTLSPEAHVMVSIHDSLDPSHKLFFFEGTVADLVALAGGRVTFSGPFGVVVRIPLTVPAGVTLWAGRMELTQGGYRCHADIYLLQGVPFWMNPV